jgi:hypothetical protein
MGCIWAASMPICFRITKLLGLGVGVRIFSSLRLLFKGEALVAGCAEGFGPLGRTL